MKVLLLVILGLTTSVAGHCQLFSPNWEKIQQVAKLAVYIRQLEQGYEIARKGLAFIGAVKQGHFNLDQGFFAGLEAINPNIKGWDKVDAIALMQRETANQCQAAIEIAEKSGDFSADERMFVKNVTASLLNGCADISSRVSKVLSPAILKMSDDERLRILSECYGEMRDRYEFSFAFASEMKMQSLARQREKRGLGTIELLR